MQHIRAAVVTFVVVAALGFPAATGADAELAQGKFLVASTELGDPNFKWTVVLLLDYGPHGAMGLVINRPTKIALVDILPELDALQDSETTAFAGGPVQVDRVTALVRSGEALDAAHHVFEDVYASRSPELLQRLSADAERETSFRVYVGYAGWSPGQLDHEVERGDWHVVPADPEAVFGQGSIDIWRDLIPGKPGDWTRRVPRSSWRSAS